MYNSQSAKDALIFDIRVLGEDYRMGEFFMLSHFASRDGAPLVYVNPSVIALANHLHRYFGKIDIHSAYRTKEHNARVGGASRSKHLYGMAIDVSSPRANSQSIAQYAETLRCGGIGLYDTFVHVDVAGVNRRWKG